MNEDYLWDKTGSDSGIEDLEELFAPLRYIPTAPPALRVAKPAQARWLTGWLTPAAGLLTAATLLLAVGINWRVPNQGNTSELATAPLSVPSETKPPMPAQQPGPPSTPRQIEETPRAVTALHVPKSRSVRPVRTAAKPQVVKRDKTEITEEELQAYQQVMLALSIASDKLKIVSEAANGSEE